MADNDVFSANPVEIVNEDITLADLAGEGKKYKEPDEVAKAYVHIEGHARNLERDNSLLRSELELLREATKNRSEDDQEPPLRQDPPDPALNDPNDEKDFRSRIREEVKALSQEERSVRNAEEAAQKMVEVYGNVEKANEAVRRRAQELSVSTDWLKDAASRSPSAFYATMEITSVQNRETPASSPGLNINRSGEKVRNFEYFDKIRKEDSKLYWSANIQREMQRLAREMGDDFYKR